MDSRNQARRPRRIVVPGPLAPFADGLRQDLAGQGYALDTVTDHVHLLADLSGWLAGRGLAAADLTGEAAGEFVGARRAAGHRCGVTAQALAPVLRYLRSVQAVPAQEQPVPASPLEELLAVYQQYLEGERGLSASTIRHYLRLGYLVNRSRLWAWSSRVSASITRGRLASSRPGSAPMQTAWTTWTGCAGRAASPARPVVMREAGSWVMAGVSAPAAMGALR
jgi:hypothetical protein